MSNLRWIERDGKMVLQQHIDPPDWSKPSEWADVPTHQEPKKVEVPIHECKHMKVVKVECNQCKDETKRVTVEDELVEIIKSERWSDYPCHAQARAAIAFMKARMPKPVPGYEDAFKDVRKSLFGDENA